MGHVHHTINSNTHAYTSRVTDEDIRGKELDLYNTKPSCQELAKPTHPPTHAHILGNPGLHGRSVAA